MTRSLARPWAALERARNTSAIPPAPSLRRSWYLPNCSKNDHLTRGQGRRTRVAVAVATSGRVATRARKITRSQATLGWHGSCKLRPHALPLHGPGRLGAARERARRRCSVEIAFCAPARLG